MLRLTITPESFDEKNNEFVYGKERVFLLEHSLISISKWESIWKKSFLMGDITDSAELVSYIQCMSASGYISPEDALYIFKNHGRRISAYIYDSQTATTISKPVSKGSNRQIVTSELIYYWMVHYNIPSEYEKWHLNRLLILIDISRIYSRKGKKGSRLPASEVMARHKAINAERRKNAKSQHQ